MPAAASARPPPSPLLRNRLSAHPGIEHNLKEFEEHIIKVFEDLAAIVHELHSSAGLWAKVKEACAQIGKLIKDLYDLFTDHVIEEIKEGMEKLASIVHDIINPVMWHQVLARVSSTPTPPPYACALAIHCVFSLIPSMCDELVCAVCATRAARAAHSGPSLPVDFFTEVDVLETYVVNSILPTITGQVSESSLGLMYGGQDAKELVEEEAEDWLEWKDNKYYTQITTITASYKSGDTFTCGKTVGILCVEFL